MSSLIFILKRSLINTVKGLVKKPAALVAYIVMAAFFIGIFFLSGLDGGKTGKGMDIEIVTAMFVAYIVFLFVISLASSLTSGASFFRMADVNLLFTAPLKAGNILIYGFVKQMAINMMVLFFLVLQYPNWKRMFGFVDGAGLVLIIAYILIIILTSMLGIVFYSFSTRKPGRRELSKRLLYAGTIIFLLPIAYNTIKTGDIFKSSIEYLSSDYISYIPFIGWFREVLLASVKGMTASFALNSFLILGTSALIFIYLYRMDTGFYEDVLTSTENKEVLVKAMRDGKSGAAYMNTRKYKKVKFSFTMEGSKAVFQRQLLEQRKTGLWFIDMRTIIFLACAVIASFTVKVEGSILLAIFLVAAVYIMMIFTMIGSWAGELSKHYVYLIPATPISKMMYSTIAEVIKILAEGIIVFVTAGILVKAPVLVIISAVAAYVSMGAVFTYSDLFVRRVFGKIHGNVLRVFFRVGLFIFILVPVIIAAGVIIAITKNFTLAFSAAAAINLLMVSVFMLVGVSLFKNPEFE